VEAPVAEYPPPATSTKPFGNNVAVCDARAVERFPVGNHEVATIESTAVELTVPIVAVIVVVPIPTPVAMPVVGPTVATDGALDVQLETLVTTAVVESENVPMAAKG
jgi:hypothetical protein